MTGVRFSWAPAADAADYLLEIAESQDFSAPAFTNAVSGTNALVASPLTAGRRYFWRVAARDTNGVSSATAEARSFSLPDSASLSFREGFEDSSFPGWARTSGTPSQNTSIARDGRVCYRLDQDADAITLSLINLHHQKVSLWLYDTMNPKTVSFATVDSGWDAPAALAAHYGSSEVYRLRTETSFFDTVVRRSKGWHKFVWDFSDGESCRLSIDGIQVCRKAATGFNRIQIGDIWGNDKRTSSDCYDLLRIEAGTPRRLFWNGGEGEAGEGGGGVWRDGGGGWLAEDGGEAVWEDGADAVFTNAAEAAAAVAEGGVTANSVSFDGPAPFTLTGGALRMEGDAAISVKRAPAVVLDVPLGGPAGLSLRGRPAAEGASFPGPVLPTSRLVFPGASLGEIDWGRLGAEMCGPWINGGVPLPAAGAYHAATNEEGVSVQFQVKEGTNVKCVKVLFTGGDKGVHARTLWANYVTNGAAGMMFDGPGSGSYVWPGPDETKGYGVCNITAPMPGAEAGPGRFVVKKPAAFTEAKTLELERGRLEFEGDGRLGAEGDGLSGAGGFFRGGIVNHGAVAAPAGRQFFEGAASGTGSFLVQGDPAARLFHIDGVLEKNREYTVVEAGGSLAGLTGAGGFTAGDRFGAACVNVPYTYAGFETKHATNTAVHLQIYDYGGPDNHHTKGVRIQLYEHPGGKITAVRDHSYYYENTNRFGSLPGGADPQPTSYDHYGVQRVCFSFGGRTAATRFRDAAWTGGLDVRGGAAVYVDGPGGLPSEGTIEASGGGEIRCYGSTAGQNSSPGGTNPVRLRDGGVLVFAGPQVFSQYNEARRVFLVDGGLIRPYAGAEDSVNYLNHLDVLNGGTVLEGPPFRAGHQTNALLRVRGDAPCYQKAGYRFCGEAADTVNTLTLDVEDVTKDAGADLVISGKIVKDPSYHDLKTVKTGAGTAVYSGMNSHNGPTSIDEGTLRFETPSPLGTNAPVILNGGTLDLGTCVNASPGVGALSLSAGGVIRIGGGTLAFADSSAAEWAPDAVLTIAGGLGERRLRFGTSEDGLTARQLRQIRVEGDPGACPYLDGDGWLRRCRGTIIILR